MAAGIRERAASRVASGGGQGRMARGVWVWGMGYGSGVEGIWVEGWRSGQEGEGCLGEGLVGCGAGERREQGAG